MPPFENKLPHNEQEIEPQIEYKDGNPISSGEWQEFVVSKTVSEERVLSIYYKIKNGVALSQQELAIQGVVAEKIEKMLRDAVENETH